MGAGGSGAQGRLADKEVGENLKVLCDSNLPQARRRPAFLLLRQHFAPVTSGTAAFAEELRRTFALRFEPWESPPADAWPTSASAALADSVRGCIYGAALGDAAGLATEFLPRTTVAEHYGEDFQFAPGCEVYADSHRMAFPAGDWTDDTDQLLLILQSLLEAGGRADEVLFARKLMDWRERGFPGLGDQGAAGLGQHTKAVLQRAEFAESPKAAARAVWEKGGRKSASNGAVMRTAVTGIPFFWDLDSVLHNTSAFCEATHADPRCLASCVLIAASISLLLQAAAAGRQPDVQEVLAFASAEAERMLGGGEESLADFRQHLRASQSLDDLGLDDPRGLGYTFKCMGCGAWALNSSEHLGFEELIQRLVRQGGDADTNACVAGAVAGCRLGYRRLPRKWVAALPYAAWLEAWVQKLLFMLRLPVAAPASD